jgi:hypothetical protein
MNAKYSKLVSSLWLVALTLVVLTLVAWWWRCGRELYTAEYTTRSWTGSSWKCPDGYSDTGNSWDMGPEKGAKQCRKKSSNTQAQKYMRKKQRDAKKSCGARPQSSTCDTFKCQKNDEGGYAWVCTAGADRQRASDERMMGCSTDGTSNSNVSWNGSTCCQGTDGEGGCHREFGMCVCCEGPPGGMDKQPGQPGHRTCPGKGRTTCDGC